jgi:DNA-binding Xre family transcriptional regulator
MDLPRALANTLRSMRRDADVSQAEMARRLGISRVTLTRLENADQNTTLKTLAQLCRALRCSVGDLFGGHVTAPGARRR